jgi:hypothetical protein
MYVLLNKLNKNCSANIHIFGKTWHHSINLAKLKNNSIFLAKLEIIPYFWQNCPNLEIL